ncbi:phosphotransferase [Bacillus sp. JCM 19041]|uniref:phosphotransferase n=1 Tax=Bacillus sp. JCM 19041 TaxID=1460637 RepID=UPI0006D163B5
MLEKMIEANYGLLVKGINQLSDHNEAATYDVDSNRGRYVLKRIPDSVEDPEREGVIIHYLHDHGIPVSKLLPANNGSIPFVKTDNAIIYKNLLKVKYMI